ncbi:hypothetical protein ATW55_10120 [Ferroacidibacillus organovorans]|uniref:Glycosyltransferase RgtA/B/C/D-like domain-containing protein n=1 Tax=Ferroacidibacillus organovorans TaxID=1765683 RepID=A0A101XNS1_9BACL|nr:hypothetical protein ATW55_10120 [Ferroacidibacillus organovorans]
MRNLRIANHSGFLWLLLINLVLRFGFLAWMHPPQSEDFAWYFYHAVDLAKGLGYRRATGGYTAYWPIGYPFFLSLIYRVFPQTVWVGLVTNALLSVGIVALTYLLTFRIFARKGVALAAAAFYTALPSQIEWNAVLGSEELFTILLMIFLAIFTIPPGAMRRPWVTYGSAGVVLGMACDVRPIPLLFPFMAWGIAVIWRRAQWRFYSRVLVYVLAGMAFAILPVSLRNWIAMHHFILISTNGGVNLWQGIYANRGFYWLWNPAQNPLLAAHGNEIRENAIGMNAFFHYLFHHPLNFFENGLYKIRNLYASDQNAVHYTLLAHLPHVPLSVIENWRRFDTYAYYGFMIFVLIGFFVRRNLSATAKFAIQIVLLYLFYDTVIFLAFPAWSRFRYPMMPMFALFAGSGWMGIGELFRRIKHRKNTELKGG